MIEAFQYINKAFESKVRLGIMAILMVNEEADFNFLKEQLSLTDGNLASHTRALEIHKTPPVSIGREKFHNAR